MKDLQAKNQEAVSGHKFKVFLWLHCEAVQPNLSPALQWKHWSVLHDPSCVKLQQDGRQTKQKSCMWSDGRPWMWTDVEERPDMWWDLKHFTSLQRERSNRNISKMLRSVLVWSRYSIKCVKHKFAFSQHASFLVIDERVIIGGWDRHGNKGSVKGDRQEQDLPLFSDGV